MGASEAAGRGGDTGLERLGYRAGGWDSSHRCPLYLKCVPLPRGQVPGASPALGLHPRHALGSQPQPARPGDGDLSPGQPDLSPGECPTSKLALGPGGDSGWRLGVGLCPGGRAASCDGGWGAGVDPEGGAPGEGTLREGAGGGAPGEGGPARSAASFPGSSAAPVGARQLRAVGAVARRRGY